MRTKAHFVLVIVCACLLFFACFTFMRSSPDHLVCETSDPVYVKPLYMRSIDVDMDRESRTLQDTLKGQRDRLAAEMNVLRQKLGQMDCQKSEGEETSSAGGWCKKVSTEDGGQHMTDQYLVRALSKFLKGKTVGSFGDGPGVYKRELLKAGDVKSYDAFDGAPYCEETSEGRVKFMDLTIPQYGIPIYDWIISLEVAEHIPKESEAVYIDNIVRHSTEGVILSWAVPGQGGLAHINMRPLSYVIDLMEIHGFKHDNSSSMTLRLGSSFQWLRDNVNVFRRFNKTNLDIIGKWYT